MKFKDYLKIGSLCFLVNSQKIDQNILQKNIYSEVNTISNNNELGLKINKLKIDNKIIERISIKIPESKDYCLKSILATEYGKERINLEDILNNTNNIEAIINGGFYEPDNNPSGLIIKDYKRISNKTEYGGSGIFYIDSKDIPHIDYRWNVKEDINIKQALQCGPLLVKDGKNMLEGKKLKGSSYFEVPRSVVSIDSENNIYFDLFNNINLEELAKTLSKSYEASLNLDGGPSSIIYLKNNVNGELIRNKHSKVQNYLGVFIK